ncbi:MAG: 4-(cytidine 5'-diphospho)-2-C-methyl-D-erythritol kinase [Paracoccaceae bacterium]|uniref:4-(cytidine 5'-diphospho)-2-C-methyl-D-erythritol kinase n=1 Tax=Seohaeicola saemankumensis TaxID=481181 RepID=UPI001E286922|nr:4-(cytidine 5'-diphospho)-2-C-methyl-D-erythritol kinase [Seohaeicola saemankumensis]MCD1626190.1 4-(cytidine 5'-diphospho)-2-C-methyl-D-erythritol kinase [Seohaeicola saemankumensis]
MATEGGVAKACHVEHAPAKINLTLHVTGQRADGYHLLDSLVVFADLGDRLTLTPAATPALSVAGPMAAGVPAGADNLVLRAAQVMGVALDIRLDKHLPAAAGIGGGSSDAAAVLRGVLALRPDKTLPVDNGLSLGADVPVCLVARAARMRGIGEQVSPVDGLPPLHAVLVNPRVSVSTAVIFRTLARRDNTPMPAVLPPWADAVELAVWLAAQRNDMQAAAIVAVPVVGQVIASIAATQGCLLARMSGSGATCFGLFADADSAAHAAQSLAGTGWWVKAVRLR